MAPRSSARQPAGSAETAPVRKRIRSLTSVADVPVATASESSKPESAPAAAPRRGRSSSSTVAATDDTTARAEPQEAVTGLDIAPEPEEAHVADVATDGLSAYELERLESIRRNNQVLAELGLLDASASLRGTSTARRAAAASRGIKPKRERAVTAELPRRSMRSRNLAPDATTAGGVASEAPDGTIRLADGSTFRRGQSGYASAASELPPPPPPARLPARRLNTGGEADEQEEQGGEGLPAVDGEMMQLVAGGVGTARRRGGGAARVTGKGGVRGGGGGGDGRGGGGDDGGGGAALLVQLQGLRLESRMVAKVTKSAAVHLVFQPRLDDTLLLAAADKEGHVSLWHPDAPTSHPSDGVHLHKPHRAYVSGLEWSDGDGFIGTAPGGGGGAHTGGGGGHGRLLHSASYDGCVYTLDASAGCFLLHHTSNTHEWSAFCLGAPGQPTTRLFFLGSNGGAIAAVDPRAPGTTGAAARAILLPEAHNKKINTLSAHAGGHLLASASTDASVRIWDVRKLRDALLQIEPLEMDPPEIGPSQLGGGQIGARGPSPQVFKAKPLFSLPLGASSQSAVWAPVAAAGGGLTSLLVTSFDNQLAIYRNLGGGGGGAPAPAVVIRHNTQTGRWVVPFRAEWTSAGDGVLVGGMSRTADVYDSATGSRFASFSSEHLTAIPSRNATHPTLPVLACGTNSGRVHILR